MAGRRLPAKGFHDLPDHVTLEIRFAASVADEPVTAADIADRVEAILGVQYGMPVLTNLINAAVARNTPSTWADVSVDQPVEADEPMHFSRTEIAALVKTGEAELAREDARRAGGTITDLSERRS